MQEDLELFLSKERAKQCFEVLDFDSNGKVEIPLPTATNLSPAFSD